MKIIYDNIIYWLQKDGGASRYWHEITSKSVSIGIDCNFIDIGAETTNPWFSGYSTNHQIESSTSIRIEMYKDCEVSCQSNHLNDTIFHSSHYRVPKNKKIPNVVTVHDFTYERHNNGIRKFIHSWQKKRAIKYADAVICISNHTKNELLHFYPQFRNKKIFVVYHGVGDEFYFDSSINDINKKTNKVLFVGSRIGYKRFDIMVDTMELLPDKILTIVGGSKLSENEIKLLDSKLFGRWEYLGRVSDAKLNELYNTSHCFVFPSDSEGFGLPILEAMKCGCPVVSSSCQVFLEISGGYSFVAKEQLPASYAQQIERIGDNKHTANQISSGISHAKTFTWDKCHKDTLGVYEYVLNQRK